jgi:hypothetical protein
LASSAMQVHVTSISFKKGSEENSEFRYSAILPFPYKIVTLLQLMADWMRMQI